MSREDDLKRARSTGVGQAFARCLEQTGINLSRLQLYYDARQVEIHRHSCKNMTRGSQKHFRFEAMFYITKPRDPAIGWWKQRSKSYTRGFVIRFFRLGLAVRWGRTKK